MSDRLNLTIRLERNDDIPAFAGFLRCEESHPDTDPVIFMNVSACMSPELATEDGEPVPMTRDERLWLIITSLMHEFGHALESHFRLPVNEEAIEKACQDWEGYYARQSAAAPKEASP